MLSDAADPVDAINAVGVGAACLWIVIGMVFMLTAGTNWHDTILKEDAFQSVDVENPSVRKIFGMLTHIAFFIGELNWTIGSSHVMNSLGFSPAIAVTPALSMIVSFIIFLKLFTMGPTGLPITGPPAPVPQIAMLVGLLLNLNMAYQFFLAPSGKGVITDSTAATHAPRFLNMGRNYVAIYFGAYFVIVAVPHAIAKYHRDIGLPDWRGMPVVRVQKLA